MSWWEHAACLSADPDLWDDGPLSAYHVTVCGRCPVRARCARDALDHGDRATIRAGVDLSIGAPARRHQLAKVARR